MQTYPGAPHQGRSGGPLGSPNAALLIDFDNVTMGIRSDLTRQLKDLLNSDIIKGKVAVQRAYADWRRYAQYIVPLSEASVDLIFAPAYGSSKKNATDIRLAIDALELVFTRPEIGTFILLSGDSDFSSLVLKLKEYGKYVVGVGMRESASDLLVQNCDEYYSYSSLTGLTKAGDEDVAAAAANPWDLAERAVRHMADQSDVMRSDRLKQVMLEMEPSFDESELGFSKFNRFLTEAASKNKLALKKLDNGQYEVQPYAGGLEQRDSDDRRGGRAGGRRDRQRDQAREPRRESRPSRSSRGGRSPGRGEAAAAAPKQPAAREQSQPEQPRDARRPAPQPQARERKEEDLRHGYELLQRAVREVSGDSGPARDSDIKRQILEIEPGWDESTIGFSKFSRFLRQAHDAEVIDLQKSGEGYYEAYLTGAAATAGREGTGRGASGGRGGAGARGASEAGGAPAGRGASEAGGAPGGRGAPEARGEATRSRSSRDTGGDSMRDRTAQVSKPETREAGEQPEAGAGTDRSGAGDGSIGVEESGPAEEKQAAAAPTGEATASGEKETAPTEKEAAATGTSGAGTSAAGAGGRGLSRGRRGRRGAPEGPPPLLPGQAVGPAPSSTAEASADAGRDAADDEADLAGDQQETPAVGRTDEAVVSSEANSATAGAPVSGDAARPAPGAGADFDVEELGLPVERGAVIRYLSNSYQGVGQKTAETLIDTFGEAGVFHGLHSQPERVREVLGSGRRTEGLLDAWKKDYRRRTTAGAGDQA